MDVFKIAKKLTGSGLKLLGSALPFGGDIVTDLISNTLGVNDEESILKALEDPVNIEKLKKLEYDNKEKLKELDNRKFELENDDLNNARKKAMEDNKSTDKVVRRHDEYLSFFVIGLIFLFVFVVIGSDYAKDNRDIILVMVLPILDLARYIIKFFFSGDKKGE